MLLTHCPEAKKLYFPQKCLKTNIKKHDFKSTTLYGSTKCESVHHYNLAKHACMYGVKITSN